VLYHARYYVDSHIIARGLHDPLANLHFLRGRPRDLTFPRSLNLAPIKVRTADRRRLHRLSFGPIIAELAGTADERVSANVERFIRDELNGKLGSLLALALLGGSLRERARARANRIRAERRGRTFNHHSGGFRAKRDNPMPRAGKTRVEWRGGAAYTARAILRRKK